MIHIIVSGENCEVEANTTVDQFGSFSRAFFYDLILSMAEKEPVLNAFHIDGAASRKENLVITD